MKPPPEDPPPLYVWFATVAIIGALAFVVLLAIMVFGASPSSLVFDSAAPLLRTVAAVE